MKTIQNLIDENATVEVSVKDLVWWEEMLTKAWLKCKDTVDMLDSDLIDITADQIRGKIYKRRLQ